MPKVALGVVHSDTRASTFDDCKDALVAYDKATKNHLGHDAGRMFVRCGTDGLVAARNAVAQQAVDSDVDWLLWIDSDMGFAPDTLERLLDAADPEDRPIVGALCFASRQFAHDGMNGYRTRPLPTLYDWREIDGEHRFVSIPLYPVNQVIQVAGTGSACILIHRSVFEKIGGGWYDRIRGHDGKPLGEDVSFCVRASAANIPIHVHTGVRTTHLKLQWVGEQDHWMRFVPPPAADRVAVRVSKASSSFIRHLRASTGLAKVYLEHDQIGDEKWVFFAQPGHRFRPGWYDHARHVADQLGACVIGVNDLSPESVEGRATSGVLVQRAWLDAHPREDLLAAADLEGVAAMALGAIVELADE